MPTELQLSIVGLQFHTKQSLRYMMKDRLPLKVRLEREPDNHWDGNALKVIVDEKPYKNIWIGYIRKEIAAMISPLLDAEKMRVAKGTMIYLDPYEGTAEGVISLVSQVRGKSVGKMLARESA